MTEAISWLRLTELDRINLPELAERIGQAEEAGFTGEPRRYPGYPTWQLPRIRRRWWPSFDKTLNTRRCRRNLKTEFPAARTLARLLQTSQTMTGGVGPEGCVMNFLVPNCRSCANSCSLRLASPSALLIATNSNNCGTIFGGVPTAAYAVSRQALSVDRAGAYDRPSAAIESMT